MTLQAVFQLARARAEARAARRRAFPLGDGAVRALCALVVLTACPTPPPVDAIDAALTLAASAATLPADGRARATLTATLDEGFAARLSAPVVAQFTTTGGLLSSTTARADAAGRFVVDLLAEGPESLLGAPTRDVTVRAVVVVDESSEIAATTTLALVMPVDVPVLTLAIDPAVAVADGATQVDVEITLHNFIAHDVDANDGDAHDVDAPVEVTLSTSAGLLSATTIALAPVGDAHQGHATLTAPFAPALAEVVARLVDVDGSATRATALVDFVDADGPQFDLTGTFAELAFARVKMTSSTLTPSPQCAVAPSILRIEIVQEGDVVTMTHTPCQVTLPPVTSVAGTVTTETPPAFLAALPVVTDETTLTSRALGAPLLPPESLVVVGAELANPRTDPLPTSPDDERVRDDDEDGEPGVTVISSLGGEQHATYRNRGQLMGRVQSSTRIDGSIPGELIAVTETSVLGVGNSFLPVTTPLPGIFEMVRVDGAYGSIDVDGDDDGTITCTEIVDAAVLVFTLTAPVTPADCGGL